MARPEDSRRVEDAGHPDLGTDRLPAAPEVAATTQPELEELPAQSPGSDGLHRILHRAYDHDEGVVRVPDCLDHFIIFNAPHLKRTLSSYFYHGSRTHLGLDNKVRMFGRSR